jgi:hypothetical protein
MYLYFNHNLIWFPGEDSANDSEDTEEGYDSEEQDPAIEESIQNIIDAAATGKDYY